MVLLEWHCHDHKLLPVQNYDIPLYVFELWEVIVWVCYPIILEEFYGIRTVAKNIPYLSDILFNRQYGLDILGTLFTIPMHCNIGCLTILLPQVCP